MSIIVVEEGTHRMFSFPIASFLALLQPPIYYDRNNIIFSITEINCTKLKNLLSPIDSDEQVYWRWRDVTNHCVNVRLLSGQLICCSKVTNLRMEKKILTLILRRSRTGTVWFYTSTGNKRAARPKPYTKSLTRDLKRMYSRFTLVRISIKL